MKLYDKAGKAYDVPHAIDQREWLATGDFFKENPKEAKKKKAEK
jgi:hypothetical protein